MAENNVEAEPDWNDWALDAAEDTVIAMETLLATLRAFEDVLRQQEISIASSTEYCDNFCQALMHYAGSRNSIEHGLPLLEVYCLSINCFAAARSHLTAESDRVGLVLKRLALSCFELLLSVPENEIPYEAWLQFHHSVQIAHDTLIQYGSTDLQALLQITGEGGAWSNPILSALLTGQPTSPEDVNAYISLEGEGFMEMRVKHLEKMGEVAKAGVLAKACAECNLISNQGMFRQIYVAQLCHLLPNEEAIIEISRLDCKDVLEITCSLETEGEENTAFILCTTFLTQQLQQQSLYCSWDLISLWSKLQRRLDPSSISLLERCLQLGAIAKTVQHLLYLVRVIQEETETFGTRASVELCVKALQLPKQDDSETRTSICKMVSCLLSNDLEVLRACKLTEFLLDTSQETFNCLKELYLRPDQKRDQEGEAIPNSLRCELLLVLKAYWPFDPEFWDWKTLKYHCISLLGIRPESEEEEEEEEEEVEDKQEKAKRHEPHGGPIKVEPEPNSRINGGLNVDKSQINNHTDIKGKCEIKRPKLRCQICKRSITDIQIIHHSQRHAEKNNHPCPVCLEDFRSRKDLLPHLRKHIKKLPSSPQSSTKTEATQEQTEDEEDVEPGEITLDPSLMLYYKSTQNQDPLHDAVGKAKTPTEQPEDNDEYVTFDYIDKHFKLQNREVYPCPGTKCNRIFKHSKYLYVHLKSEHRGDENVKHFHQMRDKREKCVFCRRHFVSAYHHRKHRKVHYGDQPYMCVVIGCGARFGTSNELVMHKHTHGFQLNYQCELKGCSVTYSDLGQIYHHEAQHFRDAAFTCSRAECKKFFLSKKDFLKHLSTHNITFTENDFEAQRRAKRKFFKTVREVIVRPIKPVNITEAVNGNVLNSQSVSCGSSLQEAELQEPKATVTLVAVCFDGSKFTCGFERCGMTFSRARDVQRHLKCAHPEHLKLENREQKHEKGENSVPREVKPETEPESGEQREDEPSPPLLPLESAKEKKVPSHTKGGDTNPSGVNTKSDALKEILIGLSKLSLGSSPSQGLQNNTLKSNSDFTSSSIHQAIIAKPPVVLLKKRRHLLEEQVKSEAEQTPLTSEEEGVESLATARPYVCEIKRCGFRTARSYSLLRHYLSVHSRTIDDAKRMTASIKPYKCHLCPKSHREKKVLKAHYITVHNMSEDLFNNLSFASAGVEGHEGSAAPQATLQLSANHSEKAPNLPHQHNVKEESGISENGENGSNLSSVEDGEEEGEIKDKDDEQKEQNEDNAAQQVRTRRVVAKSNLCYILDKFSKPFHCVAKNCDAAFSTQGGLVRHLQLVHRYNRSQLLLEKDGEVPANPEARREPSKRRPLTNSDEPQPQFKCHFANCFASYHLKSSLVRHTRDVHSRPPELIRCKFDGCSRVFSHNEALKKHTLYSHYEYYDSLVLRLQSTHKKSVTGCQKKVIVTPTSPEKEETSLPTTENSESEGTTQSEEKDDSGADVKKASGKSGRRKHNLFSSFVFRSHEEALQMCQDRCLRTAYPCMVQDCDSVVTYLHSLHRHYLAVHRMYREDLYKNEDKLVFTAEKLEVLIQAKSARPAVSGEISPEEAPKTELQAEAAEEEQPPPLTPPALEAASEDKESCEPLDPPEEEKKEAPPDEKSEAANETPEDELIKEEAPEELPVSTPPQTKPDERSILDKFKPLLRPVTVDLSPPCSLHFSPETGNKDGAETNTSTPPPTPSPPPTPPPSAPVRMPLKRKNEQLEQPFSCKETKPRSPSPSPFDIAAYKPMGFESSFLQFIQEKTPIETEEELKSGDALKRSCSVKENNQLGVSHTRSKRTHSPPEDGNFTSVQNLKSILDRALAGCGDLAVKQLQYLRPVVVLGRPVTSTATPDLFPSKTNSKLLLGS
ncbi:PREDICTED: zinc finger protein Rlf [Cyprinodon variegatus]|uniref:Rearranged L-myc fusion n=1 Tax=Cyprinodon variegatus TaxID=28743 RepID=A0A3Q2EI74_CYPVA|nr:PREDICTED: zinc finger protein Rlf [Cyprinodon variegatus]